MQARSGGRLDLFPYVVRLVPYLASAPDGLALVGVGQEVRGQRGGRCRGGRCYVDGSGHGDGAFVSRTAEASDWFLVASRNRRRTALLQADDVAAEAETEVARIVARYLLGRDVDFAAVAASSGTESALVFFAVVFFRSLVVWFFGHGVLGR